MGNGIDPIEVIDEYGCDALRVSLLIGISPGNDSRYYTEKIESGRNFTNKLWNISRFIIGDPSTRPMASVGMTRSETLSDRWILSRFATVTQEVTDHLENHEFSQAGEKLRDFTWNEFADWYLEIAKVERQEAIGKREEIEKILFFVLQNLLKLWHPFMPFVTEVIWSNVSTDLLMIQSWPESQDDHIDKKAEQDFSRIQNLIVAIRNIRAQYKIQPSEFVNLILQTTDSKIKKNIEENLSIVKALARVGEIIIQPTAPENAKDLAVAILDQMTVFIVLPTSNLESENARMQKEKENLQSYILTIEKKLSNKEFVEKAPQEVVESMRQKLQDAKDKLGNYVSNSKS